MEELIKIKEELRAEIQTHQGDLLYHLRERCKEVGEIFRASKIYDGTKTDKDDVNMVFTPENFLKVQAFLILAQSDDFCDKNTNEWIKESAVKMKIKQDILKKICAQK